MQRQIARLPCPTIGYHADATNQRRRPPRTPHLLPLPHCAARGVCIAKIILRIPRAIPCTCCSLQRPNILSSIIITYSVSAPWRIGDALTTPRSTTSDVWHRTALHLGVTSVDFRARKKMTLAVLFLDQRRLTHGPDPGGLSPCRLNVHARKVCWT